MSQKKGNAKVRELVEGIQTCMFVTQDTDGSLKSRPMNTNEMDEQGNIWFFTEAFTEKVEEFQENRPVNLAYAKQSDDDYVSVSGKAFLTRDRAQLEEKWNPVLKAWFPDGLETKGIALIKVVPESAEYWDATDNKLVQGIQILKAMITGERHQTGEHAEVEMS